MTGNKMKQVLHINKRDVFESWINEFCASKQIKYIWPQICYDNQTGEIIHLVFEKNNKNKDVIEWPVKLNFKTGEKIPSTSIDFTQSNPKTETGEDWNYHDWYKHALGGHLQSTCLKTPQSFWNWRSQTRPQGNLTCDLDFLFFKSSNQIYYGFEATEIYYVDRSQNINQDVNEHFERLLKKRKGNMNGFNTLQIKAQLNLLAKLEGGLGLILHQIVEEPSSNQNQIREMPATYNGMKTDRQFKLRDDKVVTLKIDEQTIQNIRNFLDAPSQNNLDKEKSQLRFQSLVDVMSKIVE